MDAVLCINKCDLASDEELVRIQDIYEGIYPMFLSAQRPEKALTVWIHIFPGKRAAFAGPSGVGKSTITNLIVPQANMETGKISSKTSRGKHTTRHVEIF